MSTSHVIQTTMARTRITAGKIVGQKAKFVRLGHCRTNLPNEAKEVEAIQGEKLVAKPGISDVRDPVSLITNASRFRVLTRLVISKWCSGCSNGGHLVDCSFCVTRSACDICILFPDAALLESSQFMCPVCHMENNAGKPYYVRSFRLQ
jgi:hypothetical protein